MALNSQYMITPNLQEVFLDDTTGLPLAGGKVFYYRDTARSTLKPVYFLDSSSGSYEYTVLPNPVTLSSAGSTLNEAGADVKVNYFPYDDSGNVDNYYIVVTDAAGNVKLVREAWPELSTETQDFNFNYNFVRNPNFFSWSNGTTFNNIGLGSSSLTDFVLDDWTYHQDDPEQTINISQGVFSLGDNSVPGNPPYYLIYHNTSGGVSQSVNQFQQTYQSVQTLNNTNVAASIWINQISGTPAKFTMTLTQDFGSGGSGPVINTVILVDALTVGSWTLYTGSVYLPSISSYTPGTNSSLILSLNMPLNETAEIHIGPIRLESGTSVQGTDEISNDDQQRGTNYTTLYPAFTTGDVKQTIKTANTPGWLLMNNQTIGQTGSNATNTGISLYALYTMIWTNINSPIWAPIFDSSGNPTTYGANAAADWSANKALSLTRSLGRVFANANPDGVPLVIQTFVAASVNVGGNYITLLDSSSFYTGTAVSFATTTGTTLPAPLTIDTTYYIINIGSDQIKLASTLLNAITGNADIVITTQGTYTGDAANLIQITGPEHVLGSYLGEDGHALVINEIPAHTHPAPSGMNLYNYQASSGGSSWSTESGSGDPVGQASTTGSAGGGAVHNNVQPTTYLNTMIKL